MKRAQLCADDEVLWVWINAERQPLQRRVEASKWKHQSNRCDCYESRRTNETHRTGMEVVQPRNNTTIRYVQRSPQSWKSPQAMTTDPVQWMKTGVRLGGMIIAGWTHLQRITGNGILKKTDARRDVAISVLGMSKLHQNNLQKGAEALGSHSNQIKSRILTDFAGCL